MNDLAVSLTVVFAGVIAFGIQQWLRLLYERRQERRDLEIGYLLDAYLALSRYLNRAFEDENGDGTLTFDPARLSDEEADEMELAITTAGLHGSLEIAKKADAFVKDADNWFPKELMFALRDHIREKFGREPLGEDIVLPWVHVGRVRDRPDTVDDGEQESTGHVS